LKYDNDVKLFNKTKDWKQHKWRFYYESYKVSDRQQAETQKKALKISVTVVS
jgi:hypothetical protein